MEVITATDKYAEQISAMYQEFFIHNANQQPAYYKAAIENGKYPNYIISNDKEDLIIALEDEIVLGFIHVVKDKTPPFDCYVQYKHAVIIDLYVLPNYRKQGIATKLIEAAVKWAENRSLSFIELTVLNNNHNAIHFFEKEDFKVVSHLMRRML